MAKKPFLRETTVAPRVNALLPLVAPSRRAAFEQLIGSIWSNLLERLNDPIAIKLSSTRRAVTVLGFSRYVVNRRSGFITLQNPVPDSFPRRFRNAGYCFSADMPFRPTVGLFEELLREWTGEFSGFAVDSELHWGLVRGFQSAVRRACLASTRWYMLRHQVRTALCLDPEVLDLARRTRANVHQLDVSDIHYNHVVGDLDALRRLRDDNASLLWLYGLAKEESVQLKVAAGGLIEALRERVLSEFKLPPSAWRFLANGRRHDFQAVLDWLGQNAQSQGRWQELREWLRLRVALAMDDEIPAAVQKLFMHDLYTVEKDGAAVKMRETLVPIQIVRSILREATARSAAGTLRVFAECELADVLVWIRESGVAFDSNQLKVGWQYLCRRAADWKHDVGLKLKSDELTWASLIDQHANGCWQVSPVTDVWQLHRAAQHFRNCMDNYLPDCVAGNVRMFAVETLEGRRVGALGIVRKGRQWCVLDARGFANVGASRRLKGIAESLAERYTLLWQVLHPLLDQHLPAEVAVPIRAAAETVEDDSSSESRPVSPGDYADDDDVEDDECRDGDDEDARSCSICGCSDWECGHLVASVDYFGGGVCSGVLCDVLDGLTDRVKERVQKLALAGCSVTGLGADFDKVLSGVSGDLREPNAPADVMGEYDWPIRNAIVELVSNHPAVSEHYWEFDGGMPGCSTCGRDYWAMDPDLVMADVSALLAIDDGTQSWKAA